jgi:hypothetical protein
MHALLGGSAILEACLAKVNGKNVQRRLETIAIQLLTKHGTFASLAPPSQDLPSSTGHAQPNWPRGCRYGHRVGI